MEERIKQTARCVRLNYLLFWALPLLCLLAGELGGGWVGLYAADVKAVYLAETLIILLAALCVPASLKLFAWMLDRQIDRATLPHALTLYVRWSVVRLLLLSLPVVGGLLIYYAMLSSKGLLCALIALTASLFCLPGEGRLRSELHIEKESSL
mgnify:CR=1 FL=1